MKKTIEDNGTIAAIDRYYESQRVQRRRLGLSQAGHPCSRYLWYKHNGYDEPLPDGRVLRLFQLGNILEDQTADDLNDSGFVIDYRQYQVNIQFDDITLHGELDGIITGLNEAPKTPHIWEHKTASKKSFEKLIKLASYREWSEIYYWQLQFYMIASGLKRAAAFVYCKDDSRLYMERIPLDNDAAVDRLQDIFLAIGRDDPPNKMCASDKEFSARFCPFMEVCFGN